MRSVVAGVIAAPWVVWALLRTLGVELPFPLVALVSFTPYAAITSPLPVLIALALRRRAVALVAALATLLFALALVPRALAGPQPEAQGPRLVVMTSNLWLGPPAPRALLKVAREHDVDVLSVQELRQGALDRLDADGIAAQFPHGRITRPDPG